MGTYEVSSSQFHLRKSHPLAWKIMELTSQYFRPERKERNHIGPVIATRAVKLMYRKRSITNFHAKDFTLLPSFTVTPTWNIASLVWSPDDRNEEFFPNLLRCSFVHHVFMSHFSRKNVTGNAKREIYSYLGPKVCPISFKDLDHF